VSSAEVKYYEDFTIGGEERFLGTYELTEAEILEVGRRWDPQPWHVDPRAARDSIFGGLVAASAHLFAVSSWFGQRMPTKTATIAALGFDELRLVNPGRVGDLISASAVCIAKRESKSKPDRGIIRSRMTLTNQHGDTVLSMVTTFLCLKRPVREGAA
jgi:acyl dehydratase